MPTGYTSDILNDISFEEYALQCCEAHIRRAGLTPDTYHKDELALAWSELVKLKSLKADEIDSLYDREYQTMLDDYHREMSDHKKMRNKYEAMKLKVDAWEPPTEDHNYFKHFMSAQIDISMDSDCPTLTGKFPPERVPPTVWYNVKIEELEEDIEYHGNAHGESVNELLSSRLWIKQVEDSLK